MYNAYIFFHLIWLRQTQFYQSFTMYHIYLPIAVHCIGFHFYNTNCFNLYTLSSLFLHLRMFTNYILIHHKFSVPLYTICHYIQPPTKKDNNNNNNNNNNDDNNNNSNNNNNNRNSNNNIMMIMIMIIIIMMMMMMMMMMPYHHSHEFDL